MKEVHDRASAIAAAIGFAVGGSYACWLPVVSISIAEGMSYPDRPLLRRRPRWYTRVLGKRDVIAACSMIGMGLAFGVAVRLASSA